MLACGDPKRSRCAAGSFVEADGREEPGFAAAIDVKAWQRLVLHGHVRLGGLRPAGAARPNAPTPAPTAVRPRPPRPLDPRPVRLVNRSLPLQPPDGSTDSAVWEYTEGDDFSSDNLAGEYFKVRDPMRPVPVPFCPLCRRSEYFM